MVERVGMGTCICSKSSVNESWDGKKSALAHEAGVNDELTKRNKKSKGGAAKEPVRRRQSINSPFLLNCQKKLPHVNIHTQKRK